MKWQSAFQFSKSEKTGIFTMLTLIFLLMILDRTFSNIHSSVTPKIFIDSFPTENLPVELNPEPDQVSNEPTDVLKSRLFKFDPNNITEKEWQELGLKPRQIHTIHNYLSKGGKFKKPEDLRKIWGLSPSLTDQLIPFVEIQREFSADFNLKRTANSHFGKIKTVEINQADSVTLEALPGIGPAIARRIILYREKLGGFYEQQQLQEVWGLNDTVYQKFVPFIKVDEHRIRKIDVNLATKDQLKMHPYFRFRFANAIVEYRNQHGFFKTLEDIQNIVQIDEATYKKIVHYLVIK